jgi:signal transduction histidine kinase
VLSVCDNGPGVPPDVLESIFDPFFSTKDVGKGTGLGLAVVYGIIKDMGGSIDVSAGAGARFVVRFPARNNDTGKA